MANAKDHVEKVDIMKDEFGWEIPVELVPLPSKGLIYSPESALYRKESIKIKAMTAREEDILSSQALIKEGTVINHLVNSCVLESGIRAEDMVLGDRTALMIAIRITGYGTEYDIKAQCRNCDHNNEIKIDLASIPIKRLKVEPAEEGKNLFSFKLPVTKKLVTFKFLNSHDEREKTQRSKTMKKHLSGLVGDSITSSLEYAIQSIDGIKDRNKIKHFIMNMPAYDSKAIRKFMRENEPGMDMKHSFSCVNCNHENEIVMPITTEFFWPST